MRADNSVMPIGISRHCGGRSRWQVLVRQVAVRSGGVWFDLVWADNSVMSPLGGGIAVLEDFD